MSIFLETERLILKKTEQSDFSNLLALRSDPDVMKYTEQGVQTKEDVQKFLDIIVPYQKKHGYDICTVFEKNSGAFVGQAGLFVNTESGNEQSDIEIGFSLHKKYWGKGYGTELVRALIQWGFDHLTVKKLVAYTDPKNTASHHVLQKCGMMNVGINSNFVKYEIYKDDSIELVSYQTEWLSLAELEIKKLHDALPAKHVLDIQHVGSTAIPSIHSKPIIDIHIAVDSLIAIKQIAITALKNSGYEYWSDNPDKERMFFVKGMPPYGSKRTHHVHIVEPASRHWQGKIQFRDYLLSHSEAAQEYENLKMQLANLHTYDREKYTDAKTHFIDAILQKAKLSDDKHQSSVIFLTGASGSGKTTLVNILTDANQDNFIEFLHFDNIEVPSVDEMIKVYGSPSEWQKAMAYHWAKKIIQDYKNKKLVILEGQVNLDYIVNAFVGFNIHSYKIILVHCDNTTRHQRLHSDRNQPELINDDMDKWAEFLKKQAIEKNVTILDTSLMNTNEMVDVLKEYITKEKFNE